MDINHQSAFLKQLNHVELFMNYIEMLLQMNKVTKLHSSQLSLIMLLMNW